MEGAWGRGLTTHALLGEETYPVHKKPGQAKPPTNPLLEPNRFFLKEGKQIAKIATQERGKKTEKKKRAEKYNRI